MNKIGTDINQSKKLIELGLDINTADMFWLITDKPRIHILMEDLKNYSRWDCMPAWSLSALLVVLPYPQLSKDKLGSGKEGWMVSVYPDNCRYDSCWHDNPIDACIEMIDKLKGFNLL